MPDQFSKHSDANLNTAERTLSNPDFCTDCKLPRGIIPARAELDTRFDALWKLTFQIFDDNGHKDAPARFIANDGFVLARQITAPEERLDEAALEASIRSIMPLADANKLWASITDSHMVRTVSQAKLERMLKQGKMPGELVSTAMVKPKGVTSRIRRKATADDMAFLQGATAAPVDAAALRRTLAG